MKKKSIAQLAAQVSATLPLLETKAETAARLAAKWTAFDVQKTAKKSIKSGGKKRGAKNFTTSKPGEAPRSHRGTLKQAIEVEQLSLFSFIVGPEQTGNSHALRALEKGGESTTTTTTTAEAYVARAKKSKRRASRAKKKPAAPRVHPTAARSYTLYSRNNPRGVEVKDYLYFYSREAWERSRDKANFQRWANEQKTTTVSSIIIAARPFMEPALVAETTAAKKEARIRRAIK